MKKSFIKLIYFFLFCGLIYAGLIFIVGNFAPQDFKRNLIYLKGGYGHTFSRLQDASKQKKNDVLILGSSLAYRGLDTRIFAGNGLKAFNLGSSAQTPMQTKLLLNIYLDIIQPDKVIYVVAPNDFTGNGLEASLDIVANLPEINFSTFSLLADNPQIKLFNTLLFSWLQSKTNFSLYDEPTRKGLDEYVRNGGFVERTVTYFEPVNKINFRTINVQEKQIEEFQEIMQILRKNNIEVLIVRPPVTSHSYNSIKNNDDFAEKISDLGDFKDYNLSLKLTDSLHFYDSRHLNQIGVQEFTQAVIQDLKVNFKNL
ncbi:hypothetical protein [Christiangramia sp. SM2212]|uniref:SGNH hydrolase-type esterase domain-containing protein n=1 Tax=Christiangramia sediminicola TaxID=3073267 RepID=A0ABU1EP06_9FLAO|nr:hypothetical protein [Christiangramia sp. SM2212]MDR5589704.1 hypothetical protein [Christiangramia sp. SM2212]